MQEKIRLKCYKIFKVLILFFISACWHATPSPIYLKTLVTSISPDIWFKPREKEQLMKKILVTILMFVVVALVPALATPQVSPHEHDFVAVVTPPTCSSAGYTTYTCSICGEWFHANEVPALEHDFVAVVTPPTCGSAGYTTYTCSICGEWFHANEVPALESDWFQIFQWFFGNMWFSHLW